ncbi:MAG: hypothetical protein AABX28_02405 [Nanoarchaeota archaeon]
MSLQNLVGDLQSSTKGKELSKEERQKLIENRVILPERYIQFRGGPFHSPNILLSFPYLDISFDSSKEKFEGLQPVLNKAFTKTANLGLKKRIARVGYEASWTFDEFQSERKLDLSFGGVKIESSGITINPDKRVGDNNNGQLSFEKRHKIQVRSEGRNILLEGSGGYRLHLKRLAESVGAKYAILPLSSKDRKEIFNELTEYVHRKIDDPKQDFGYMGGLKEGLKMILLLLKLKKEFEKKVSMRFLMHKDGSWTRIVPEGFMFGIRNTEFPIKHLDLLEEIIRKPLLTALPPSQGTPQITSFLKTPGVLDFFRDDRVLSDLQKLAEEVYKIDFGVLYNHPLITNTTAREFLESEIEDISKSYYEKFSKEKFPYYPHNRRERLEELAIEHFGHEIVIGNKYKDFTMSQIIEKFEGTESDFIEFLRSFNYKPTQSFEEGFIPESYHEEAKKDLLNERHLLECLRQGYNENPEAFVKKYREHYIIEKPHMIIDGGREQVDASLLKMIKLPEQPLNFFSIEDFSIEDSSYNNLLIRMRNRNNFSLRINIDSPTLLPLQEYICKEIGINFV